MGRGICRGSVVEDVIRVQEDASISQELARSIINISRRAEERTILIKSSFRQLEVLFSTRRQSFQGW